MARETLRWRLISFDIRDPKRYRQAARIIKAYAVRIQYSVFRARLDDRETERLRWELARVLSEDDALLVLDLCPRCAGRVVSQNQVDDWTAEAPVVLFSGVQGDHGSISLSPSANDEPDEVR